MGIGHHISAPQETFNEDTLFKVYDTLRDEGGLTEMQARACINSMRAKGILFREKVQPSVPVGPVCRTTDNPLFQLSAPSGSVSRGVGQEAGRVGSSDVNQNPS